MHFYTVTLMKKSTSSNLLDLLLNGSHLIWYVANAGPYMASSNHFVHGLGIFRLSSNSLEWYKVMLINLCSIVILSKDVSISLYVDEIVITKSNNNYNNSQVPNKRSWAPKVFPWYRSSTIQGWLGHISKKLCSRHSRRNKDDKG